MTGKERCLAAVELRETDRVPVNPENYSFCMHYCGYDFDDVNYNGDLLADCLIKTMEDFDYDGVTVDLDNAVAAEALGCSVSMRAEEPSVARGGAIANLRDLDRLKVSNPLKDGRLHVYVECVKRLSKEIGEEKFIYAFADQGPFSLAAMTRGMENFMLDIGLMEDEEGLHNLIDFCRKCTEEFMKALVDAGAHVVGVGEALGSPDMLAPEQYKQFAFEPDAKMIETLKNYGAKTGIHICGNVTDILPLLVETGVDVLDVDYKTDLEKCHEICAGKVAVRGPIDPSDVMARGTPEEVTQKCHEAIEILGADGGFILSSGCDIMRVVPNENMQAMVESVR